MVLRGVYHGEKRLASSKGCSKGSLLFNLMKPSSDCDELASQILWVKKLRYILTSCCVSTTPEWAGYKLSVGFLGRSLSTRIAKRKKENSGWLSHHIPQSRRWRSVSGCRACTPFILGGNGSWLPVQNETIVPDLHLKKAISEIHSQICALANFIFTSVCQDAVLRHTQSSSWTPGMLEKLSIGTSFKKVWDFCG